MVWLCCLLAAASGCENDVHVELLAKPPKPEQKPVCIEGDPCSGLERALLFEGPYDTVEIGNSTLLDVPQDFAMEAWVLVSSYTGGHGILNRWTASVGDLELTFGVPEMISFLELPSMEPSPSHVLAAWGYVRPGLWVTTAAPTLPSVDVWHHLAASYGGGVFTLYVDGVMVGSMQSSEPVANAPSSLFIGATARNERAYDTALGRLWWPPMHGYIADVRLSSFNRYPEEFEPERRLSSDAGTIALWRLNEGSGTTALDSGPSGLSGTISGADWVLAPLRDGGAGGAGGAGGVGDAAP